MVTQHEHDAVVPRGCTIFCGRGLSWRIPQGTIIPLTAVALELERRLGLDRYGPGLSNFSMMMQSCSRECALHPVGASCRISSAEQWWIQCTAVQGRGDSRLLVSATKAEHASSRSSFMVTQWCHHITAELLLRGHLELQVGRPIHDQMHYRAPLHGFQAAQ